MSFKVSTTAEFESDAKILQKRHRSFKNDLKDLIISLEENPFQGVELSPGIRKIRMAIASKGRGKSGGARVITYTVIAAEMEGKVYLMSVYDKADFSTVDLSVLKEIVKISSEGLLRHTARCGLVKIRCSFTISVRVNCNCNLAVYLLRKIIFFHF